MELITERLDMNVGNYGPKLEKNIIQVLNPKLKRR